MTTASFPKEIKKEIMLRDKFICVLCDSTNILNVHHIYYWDEAELNISQEERNWITKWILVCNKCHTDIHSNKKWEWKRQQCIDYVNSLYNIEWQK